MEGSAHDWFIDIDITIPDLKVEATVRIRADPSLVVNGGALIAEVGQGHQVSGIALLALGKTEVFHYSSSQQKSLRPDGVAAR